MMKRTIWRFDPNKSEFKARGLGLLHFVQGGNSIVDRQAARGCSAYALYFAPGAIWRVRAAGPGNGARCGRKCQKTAISCFSGWSTIASTASQPVAPPAI